MLTYNEKHETGTNIANASPRMLFSNVKLKSCLDSGFVREQIHYVLVNR